MNQNLFKNIAFTGITTSMAAIPAKTDGPKNFSKRLVYPTIYIINTLQFDSFKKGNEFIPEECRPKQHELSSPHIPFDLCPVAYNSLSRPSTGNTLKCKLISLHFNNLMN